MMLFKTKEGRSKGYEDYPSLKATWGHREGDREENTISYKKSDDVTETSKQDVSRLQSQDS